MNSNLIGVLHDLLAAAAPIDGVSVADWSDKATWRVDYSAGATDTQKQAVGAVVSSFDPNNPPPPVPQVISDRQFFQQLAVQGVITQDEAIASVATGTLPASMVALVNALPPEQQFPANMLLKGATTFERSNPMVPVLGAAYGWNAAQLDALWTAAALL